MARRPRLRSSASRGPQPAPFASQHQRPMRAFALLAQLVVSQRPRWLTPREQGLGSQSRPAGAAAPQQPHRIEKRGRDGEHHERDRPQ